MWSDWPGYLCELWTPACGSPFTPPKGSACASALPAQRSDTYYWSCRLQLVLILVRPRKCENRCKTFSCKTEVVQAGVSTSGVLCAACPGEVCCKRTHQQRRAGVSSVQFAAATCSFPGEKSVPVFRSEAEACQYMERFSQKQKSWRFSLQQHSCFLWFYPLWVCRHEFWADLFSEQKRAAFGKHTLHLGSF